MPPVIAPALQPALQLPPSAAAATATPAAAAPLQGPVLRGGVLCTEQDSLEGGLSRESSVAEARAPGGGASLAAAVREDWVGQPAGPASHPLLDEGEEPPADLEDEYEGEGGWGGQAGSACFDAARQSSVVCRQQPLPADASRPCHRRPSSPPCPAGVCAGNASSDGYSDVEDASSHTEVVYVRVRALLGKTCA